MEPKIGADSSVLILAAGASSRMGTPKGLLEFNGQPWLSFQLQQLLGMGFEDCVVVLGAASERYLEMVPELRFKSVSFVVNLDWQRGPFSSLLVGLSHQLSRHKKNSCFVQLVDAPICELSVWQKLKTSVLERNALAASPLFQGRGGHPVYLSEKAIQKLGEVNTDSNDARLDTQLKRMGNQHLRIEVESQWSIEQFNTPDEWLLIKRRLSESKVFLVK